VLENLIAGFWTVVQPYNLIGVSGGVLLGFIFGVLPGLNSATAVALIIPFAFSLWPEFSFLIMIGAYCGSMFGGAVPAILFNIPGDSPAIMTCLDGHPMAKQGKAAEAIGQANISGVIGGLISCVVLIVLAPILASVALKFGPAEYFAVALFGISAITSLGTGNQIKALMVCMIGLFISMIGIDPVTGVERFTFGVSSLTSGVNFGAAIIGLYGVAEVLSTTQSGLPKISDAEKKIARKLPPFSEIWALRRSIGIGSAVGIMVGLMLEGGTIGAIIAYNEAKRWSKKPWMFGKGNPEGVVAPEAAVASSTGGAMVPTLALGIPGSGTTAVMLGSFYLYGISPGPMMFISHSSLVYTIFVGMIFANIIMGIMALMMTPYFALALRVRQTVLTPLILVTCCIGAFAIRNNIFDVMVMIACGFIGLGLLKLNFPIAPLVLGLILGPIAEVNLARTMILFDNNPLLLFSRPISGAVTTLALIAFIYPFISGWRARLRGTVPSTPDQVIAK